MCIYPFDMVKYTISPLWFMEPQIMEKAQAWAVLSMVRDSPGITAGGVCGGKAHDKAREARLRELLDAGIIRAEAGQYCGRPVLRHYLTARGELLAGLYDMLVRI